MNTKMAALANLDHRRYDIWRDARSSKLVNL
jgi:hypothetical protein